MQTLDNGILRAGILEKGAELVSVLDAGGVERIAQPGPLWAGQAKNLFPNVGLVKDGYITVRGRRCDALQHGFLKERTLDVVCREPDRVVFRLDADEQTRRFLPGNYRVEIGFQLIGNSVRQSFTVTDLDDRPLYFGLGSHTGFFRRGAGYLRFAPGQELVERIRPGMRFLNGQTRPFPLPPDGRLNIDGQLCEQGAHSLEGFSEKVVTLCEERSSRQVELDFSDFHRLTLWGLPQAGDFICLMPWCALPDSEDSDHVFEHKPGNVCLQPGRSFRCAQTMTFTG